MFRFLISLLAASIFYTNALAQENKTRFRDKGFQLSFFPGIGTNGLESAHYFNKLSLNVFGGISAGNYHLEIGGISNINTHSATGIQLAGLANIIGSNAYYNLTIADELAVIEEGFSCDLKGIQVSGLVNFVRNNAEGIQLTGGFNFNNGYVHGFQLAGLSNMAGKQVFGVQIAGLWNVALRGVTGSQASLLYNYTYGQLSGLQLGMVNRAVMMNGKNSQRPSKDRGVQVGLINIGSEMDGTQIGLINIAGKSHGVQIGLINILKAGPYKGSTVSSYGVPIGLLNLWSKGGHFRLYTDELFLTIVERTTGNCQNCTMTESEMPLNGRFKIMNQNALVFAYNPLPGYREDIKWGAGYGFEKVLYNKSSMFPKDPENGRWALSSGARVMHLNKTEKLQKKLSLLTKLHTEVGRRKWGLYFFGGISLNAYLHQDNDIKASLEVFSKKEEGLNVQYWPGYSFGIQFL